MARDEAVPLDDTIDWPILAPPRRVATGTVRIPPSNNTQRNGLETQARANTLTRTERAFLHAKISDLQENIEELEGREANREARLRRLERKLQVTKNPVGVVLRPKASPVPNGMLPNIKLTRQDAVLDHEDDVEEGCNELPDLDIVRLKAECVTDRRFVTYCARKMYSIYERAPDCNLDGKNNRRSISPDKTRFKKICEYVSRIDQRSSEKSRQSFVRTTIDQINRKYRDNLKLKKLRAQQASSADDEASQESRVQEEEEEDY